MYSQVLPHRVHGKEESLMNSHVENVTMLYLQNRDTSHLSLDELYALYRKTLKEVKDCEERYLEAHKENTFSFK